MTCTCFIVPTDVLERFAADQDLSDEIRHSFLNTVAISDQMREVRTQQAALTLITARIPGPVVNLGLLPGAAALPACTVFDCHGGTTLPGAQIANPTASADLTVKRAFDESQAVARFYAEIFGRDSIDGRHMTLISSVHYSTRFNNAFWNGAQMTYGDGDGEIFVDFTASNDVIGHELTHGVTQNSAALAYANEPGGLNESMSDVFGSMFRQWRANQTTDTADWLIGKDIMGPKALARGFTCLRDMADPAAAHALAPQPTSFKQYHAGMDPHQSSGIPNLAFCRAAKAIGGHSWEKAGQIWYQALTGFPPRPNMTMAEFAKRTRALAKKLFSKDPFVRKAVGDAWTSVGL